MLLLDGDGQNYPRLRMNTLGFSPGLTRPGHAPLALPRITKVCYLGNRSNGMSEGT